ncbi:alpha/beta hydrolase-fold protein [Spongiimicrobium salis]|uniref:alpha/beta hydrolase-fold protein n=1 Tax=Spongiimicrobium salis TaxID=1667022 RepID=UPI00374CEAC5
MALLAQTENNTIGIGTQVTIYSNILNQDRVLQIYLPDNYATSDKKYPVLYILDGQWYFSSGASIQLSLRNPDAIPEMIVVGINSSRQSRYTLFGDENGTFTAFLQDEVIAFIDSNYRTTTERIIFGWEAAAFYVSELILKETSLFSGAIISNGGGASEEAITNFNTDKEIYAYIANSKKDIFTITQSDAYYELLKKKEPKNLIWKYELFNDEFHETLPHMAMFKGIRYYYHNHSSLIFEDIEAYINSGGIPYLKSYFKERAKRFGGNGKINNGTKNSLIWLAWNRDNFEYFSFFMEEFKEVLTTKRYDSAYWQNRFGQFYLRHKDYQNAIKYFNAGLNKYPNSEFETQMKQGLEAAQKRKS